jgi:hypothetical protein
MRTFFAVVVLLATQAFAAGKPRVVVDAPTALFKLVAPALGPQYQAVAAAKVGSDAPMTKEVREACAPGGAIALVIGRAQPGGFKLTVLNAGDGAPLETLEVAQGKKPLKALPKETTQALVAALKQASASPPAKVEPVISAPAPVATPVAAATPAPAAAPPAPVEPPAPGALTADQEALRLGLGIGGLHRNFGWATGTSAALRAYELPFGLEALLDATWFPGAHFTHGPGADVGAFFKGELGLGLASHSATGTATFGTATRHFQFGVVGRLPFSPAFELDPHVGYASRVFAFGDTATDGTPRPLIPSITINGPRAGVVARLKFTSRLRAEAGVGFTLVAGLGQLRGTSFFPGASAFGLDAQVGVSFALIDALQLKLSGTWDRTFISIKPADGAALTSTGAADQYFGASLGICWVM